MTPIPVLLDLFNGVIASIQAQFNIVITTFGKSFFRGIAGAWAGQLKMTYLAIGSVQKNIWYDTADPPSQGGTLYRFGNSFLGRDPFAATQGEYTVSVTGSAGAVISAQTTFLSDPNALSPNYLFILDNDYTLTGSGDTITLRATIGSTISSLIVGNTLTATRPLVNVSQGVAVTAIVTSPVDAETDEEYRTEIGLHVRLAPQGGAFADYRIWASEFPGVARVYPYTASGAPYQVNVYIEALLADSVGPPFYGVPTTTVLNGATADILTDPLTGLARKPMGVILGPSNAGAIAVTVAQLTIQFTGTSGISLADQTTIANALVEAVNNIRPFIAGCDAIADQNDTISVSLPATTGGVAPPSSYVIIVIAMNAVPGVVFTGVNLTVAAISETTYVFDQGIIPFLDPANVTFI